MKPGDVVLANRFGTIFIPAYLVDGLVLSSEVVALRDQFGFQRLREKKYTPGQIDTKWTDVMEGDFRNWIEPIRIISCHDPYGTQRLS